MLVGRMNRRAFIAGLGCVTAWPMMARGQQPDRTRRIGVLMNLPADDAEGQARLAAFLQGLQEVGWSVGHNLRIDLRWGGGDPDSFRKQAAEFSRADSRRRFGQWHSGRDAFAAGDSHRADRVRAGR